MSFKVKESLLAGLIGGVIAATLAFLINKFLVPMPEQVLDYAIGHGISGLISGFLSGAIGVFMALKKVSQVAEK